MEFEYKKKTTTQLRNWYLDKVRRGKSGFQNIEDFLKWYSNEKKLCFYCGLTEEESQKIVLTGVLKSKRFPSNGKITQGRSRGVWLEIDRKYPDRVMYSKENCVLCCYFCNNDKSDVFDAESYKEFIKDGKESRLSYLKAILKNILK